MLPSPKDNGPVLTNLVTRTTEDIVRAGFPPIAVAETLVAVAISMFVQEHGEAPTRQYLACVALSALPED